MDDRKIEPGTVYLAECTRPDGSKQIYTGMTRRPVHVRWREHMKGWGSKWTSRCLSFRPLGGFGVAIREKLKKLLNKKAISKRGRSQDLLRIDIRKIIIRF